MKEEEMLKKLVESLTSGALSKAARRSFHYNLQQYLAPIVRKALHKVISKELEDKVREIIEKNPWMVKNAIERTVYDMVIAKLRENYEVKVGVTKRRTREYPKIKKKVKKV